MLHYIQCWLRKVLVIAVVVAFFAVGGLCVFVALMVHQQQQHLRAYKKMELAILGLASRCPADVSEDEWAHCIGCTWNLHCNYGGRDFIAPSELERIAA